MSQSAVTLDPKTAPDRIRAWLDELRPTIDAAIDRHLTAPSDDPGRLVEAMRYAALGPGKRLRPALALAACEAVGGNRDDALPCAVGLTVCDCVLITLQSSVSDNNQEGAGEQQKQSRPDRLSPYLGRSLLDIDKLR